MISTQSLAKLIQDRLNGALENGEYKNIKDFGLDSFPNKRYEFRIFPEDGEYQKSENRGAELNANPTNTYTQFINGVMKTPNTAAVEGAGASTYNAAAQASLELLIPNCDDEATFTNPNDNTQSVTVRLQDAVALLVNSVLGLPTEEYIADGDITYFVGGRYSRASVGQRQNRTQAGLSVILSVYVSFAIVAMGVSSRQIRLNINGNDIYFTRISISRTSVQENNTLSDDIVDNQSGIYGVSKARTTATQLVIAFSAPVRPVAFNTLLTQYIMFGEVTPMTVTLTMPAEADQGGDGYLLTLTKTYKMVFAQGGVAGEENLNASFDVRLVEEME